MASEVTPYRETLFTFDGVENVAVEPPFSEFRAGEQICRDPSGISGCQMLASGGWTLRPLQEDLHYLSERTDNNGAVMGASAFTLNAGVQEIKRFRPPSDLMGLTVGPNVAAGDVFLKPTTAAGSTWAPGTLDADVSAFPRPALDTTNVSMTRLAISNDDLDPDEPIYYRFETTGTKVQSPDNLFIFFFGGAAAPDGSGQFACLFQGNGEARLREKVNGTWVLRDTWRYCHSPSEVMNGSHAIRFWPHVGRDGLGHIEIQTRSVFAAPGGLLTSFHPGPADTSRRLWSFVMPNDGSRTTVTGSGPLRVDSRGDFRIPFQVSRLRFPASGQLVDGAFVLPFNVTKRAPIQIQWSASVPSLAVVEAFLYDADTGIELTSTGSGDNYKTYTLNYGQSRYYAKFTLTANPSGTLSPTLHAYTVLRDGYYIQPSETTPFNGGVVRSVSISGGEADPSHETAAVLIDDVQNVLTALRRRASLPVRIETTYDPNNQALTSVLFDGYAERNEAERMGYKGGQNYPSPYWSRLSGQWVGMWTRLHEHILFARINLANDITAPVGVDGSRPPNKVTDVVRELIAHAGFAPGQIDVPDNPTRFFPIPGGADALILQPGTNIGEWVTRTLRDWLGWFLVWDGNAGADGMWRAIPPPTSPYRNLAGFTLDAPAGKLVHRPESYGSANWTGTDLAPVVAPMLRYRGRRLRTWVKRPEANWIVVTGTGQLLPNKSGQNKLTTWAVNFDSVNAMATTGNATVSSADPSNPDYLGRLVPLMVVDPTLQTEEAVNWFARRYYDVTAHAIKMASFMAPLVLVQDTQDAYARSPRPLRYYDPVTIIEDGVPSQWLVRNVNPQYEKDSIQMAYYELEAPRI